MTDSLPWYGHIDPRFELAFEFEYRYEPRGKGSVRVVRSTGTRKDGKKRKARGIQDKKSQLYEERLAFLVRNRFSSTSRYTAPIDGPIICRILSVRSRVRLPVAERIPFDPDGDEDGRLLCHKKPDWDNIGKSICDALKKGCVIAEDSRVYDGRVVTLYGARGESPFVRMLLWRYTG